MQRGAAPRCGLPRAMPATLGAVNRRPGEGRLSKDLFKPMKVGRCRRAGLLHQCVQLVAIVDGIPLVDPVQQIWDLHDLGGEDRAEAADRLRRAVLDRALTVDHLIPAAKAGRPSRPPRSKR